MRWDEVANLLAQLQYTKRICGILEIKVLFYGTKTTEGKTVLQLINGMIYSRKESFEDARSLFYWISITPFSQI